MLTVPQLWNVEDKSFTDDSISTPNKGHKVEHNQLTRFIQGTQSWFGQMKLLWYFLQTKIVMSHTIHTSPVGHLNKYLQLWYLLNQTYVTTVSYLHPRNTPGGWHALQCTPMSKRILHRRLSILLRRRMVLLSVLLWWAQLHWHCGVDWWISSLSDL